VGIAGRRAAALEKTAAEYPHNIVAERIDVTDAGAPAALGRLVSRLGGMDVYLHVAGIGFQNHDLDPDIEMRTVNTDVDGFTRMICAAYRYFAGHGGGRIAAVSSIAGTRGLGAAASYSASKRFQNTYLDALAQLARMQRLDIRFTDIRPGFVATPLLDDGKRYPMLLRPERVADRIFRAVVRGRRSVAVDWRYAVLVFLWRLIPQPVWERLTVRN